jgi:hypothetical protein
LQGLADLLQGALGCRVSGRLAELDSSSGQRIDSCPAPRRQSAEVCSGRGALCPAAGRPVRVPRSGQLRPDQQVDQPRRPGGLAELADLVGQSAVAGLACLGDQRSGGRRSRPVRCRRARQPPRRGPRGIASG